MNSKEKGIVFDTETHDVVEPRIIEAAYGFVDEQGRLDHNSIVSQRFNPGCPINIGAMAVHLIVDEELVGMPSSDTFSLPDEITHVIGHNVTFDLNAAGNPEDVKAIDTLALSRAAWPDMDNHRQGTLYLYLARKNGKSMIEARDHLRLAHSAAADIQMCGDIFFELVEHFRPAINEHFNENYSLLDAMHYISLASAIPMKMTFGKHKGEQPWKLPPSYIDWYLRQENVDYGVALAMTRGGGREEGQQLFELAMSLSKLAVVDERNTPAQASMRYA